MMCAIVENAIVTNIISCYLPSNFPSAIPCEDYPVQIGDTYIDGSFYRNGSKVLSPIEQKEADHLNIEGELIEELYNREIEIIG